MKTIWWCEQHDSGTSNPEFCDVWALSITDPCSMIEMEIVPVKK